MRDGEWYPDINGGVIGQPPVDTTLSDAFTSSSVRQVYVSTASEQRYTIDFDANDTVALFKLKVCAVSGIPVDQQMLSQRGRQFLHGRILEDYQVVAESVINLIMRPRGGRERDDEDTDSDEEDYDSDEEMPDLIPLDQEWDEPLNRGHYPQYPHLPETHDHVLTPAQHDWSLQYMPQNQSSSWPPNALLILALLGHVTCHMAYENDSVINQRYHLLFYASWHGESPMPPVYTPTLLRANLDLDHQTVLWDRANASSSTVDSSSLAFRNATYSRVAHAQAFVDDTAFVIEHPPGYGPGLNRGQRTLESSRDLVNAITRTNGPEQRPCDLDISSANPIFKSVDISNAYV